MFILPRQRVTVDVRDDRDAGAGAGIGSKEHLLRLLHHRSRRGVIGIASCRQGLCQEVDVANGELQGVHLGQTLLVRKRRYVLSQSLSASGAYSMVSQHSSVGVARGIEERGRECSGKKRTVMVSGSVERRMRKKQSRKRETGQ